MAEGTKGSPEAPQETARSIWGSEGKQEARENQGGGLEGAAELKMLSSLLWTADSPLKETGMGREGRTSSPI